MKYNPFIAVIALIGVISAATFGAYSLARENLLNDLVGRGLLTEKSLASLSGALSEVGQGRAQIDELSEAALLYQKAKKASEEGDWFAVKAFLNDSSATELIEYDQYASALLLLGEANEKVASLEAKLADELAELRNEAKAEAAARAAAEAQQRKTEGELSDTKQAKDAQEAALLKELAETEEKRAAAIAQVEAEERDAFINEFDVYLALMTRVNTALISAEAEIEAKRDAQAIVFINQAEDLYDQVEQKGEDLRNNRTPNGFDDEMAELLKAVGVYETATKKYRLMVAELPDKGDAYESHKAAARAARIDGRSIVQSLLSFVASER